MQDVEGKRRMGSQSASSSGGQPNADSQAMDYSKEGVQAALRRAGMVEYEQVVRKADDQVFRIKKIVDGAAHLEQFLNDDTGGAARRVALRQVALELGALALRVPLCGAQTAEVVDVEHGSFKKRRLTGKKAPETLTEALIVDGKELIDKYEVRPQINTPPMFF